MKEQYDMTPLIFFKYSFSITYACVIQGVRVEVEARMCHGTHVEGRRKLDEIAVLLPSCGSQELNSDYWVEM